VLEHLMYEVKVRESYMDGDEVCGADTDALLIEDGLNTRLGEGDVVVVCSGDSDLVPLYKDLKGRGCHVEVIAVHGSVAHSVQETVNAVWRVSDGILFKAHPRHAVAAAG
jgi:uncharacterized LabA/DUF88 family protein